MSMNRDNFRANQPPSKVRVRGAPLHTYDCGLPAVLGMLALST